MKYPTETPHPTPIILDTDMGNDIDDALALAMLHALESRGECRLLGVTVCKDNPYAAAFVDVVNTFYGRGHVPIGVVGRGPTPEPGAFIEPIVNARDGREEPVFHRTAAPGDAYPPAVPLLRRLLARAADASVTIVLIGFSTNMARLLDSGPDAASDLPGRDLLARKARLVVMMAAEFSPAVLTNPEQKREYNVVNDVPSAQRFTAGCPVPIVFSGLEVGQSILYPAGSIERDFAWAARHPVAEAYRLYKPMPYDRPTWDLTAVLYACRPEHGYFGLSEPGTATVLPDGAVRFDATPTGLHRYLTADDLQRARIAEAQVALASQPAEHAAKRSLLTLSGHRAPRHGSKRGQIAAGGQRQRPGGMAGVALSILLLVMTATHGRAADLHARAQGDIRANEHVVFNGHAGWEHDGATYRLAVGAVLGQAPNGDLLLAWTTGRDKEPASDNCGVIARSSDGGKSWSEPQVLVPSKDGMQGVITDLYRTRDGKLVLYGAHLPPQDRYTTWHYLRRISEDNGRTWSPPDPFVLRDSHGSLGQGQTPIPLADGKLLYLGHWYKKRTRSLVAPAAQLATASTLAEAEAMPAGVGRTAGAFAEYWQGIQAYAAADDHGTQFDPLGAVFDRPLGLIEPTAIQLRDGSIGVLMRADWGGFLWRTDSRDGGRTWSKARQTDIPNPSSMVDLLRLPDGRIALLLNPVGGKIGERGARDPLAIWISDDEMQTWSIRATLLSGGQLAYPDSIVLNNGKVVFAYDRDRRQIRFVELDIPPRER